MSNFRELGGLIGADGRRVRAGQIYRSGHLADTSDADVARLESLGISAVVDLRSDEDLASEGLDRVPDGVVVHHVSVVDDGGRAAEVRAVITSGDRAAMEAAFGNGKAREFAMTGATLFATADTPTERFRRAMHLILDPANRPVVLHCSAGKDRAGWLATIVGLALGVDEAELIAHYLESNDHNHTLEMFRDDPRVSLAMPLIEVQAEYAQAALDGMHERWGGVEGYLRDGLGISDEQLEAFRADLLE